VATKLPLDEGVPVVPPEEETKKAKAQEVALAWHWLRPGCNHYPPKLHLQANKEEIQQRCLALVEQIGKNPQFLHKTSGGGLVIGIKAAGDDGTLLNKYLIQHPKGDYTRMFHWLVAVWELVSRYMQKR